MAEYTEYADGGSDLPAIENMIRGEEAGASEFVKSEIVTKDGKRTNLVTFNELAPGTVPNQFYLRKSAEAAPANSEKIWTGKMIVSNVETATNAYRAN